MGFVGIGDARNDAEVAGQSVLVREVIHLADDAQQDRPGDLADALDAGQIFVAHQLRAFLADNAVQLANALVQAANLSHDDPQFDLHQLLEGKGQHFVELLLAGQRFLRQVDAPRRKDVIHLVLQRGAQLHQRVPGLR
jgi:hypothetical protein